MNFYDAIRTAGLDPIRLIEDGKVQRCKTIDHPHKKNGAYCSYGDWGWIQNHATMTEVSIWQSDKPITEARRREIKEFEQLRRSEDMKTRAQAKNAMQSYYNGLPIAMGEFEYLTHKGLSLVGTHGIKMEGTDLIVPVIKGNQLISVQRIFKDGQKRFAKNCTMSGGYHIIGAPLNQKSVLTVFTEGFATGLAIYQAVRDCRVVVCFDAGNMVKVAKDLKVKGLCVVACDNDIETEKKIGKNIGVLAGIETANILKCGYSVPQGIDGTDYDDALRTPEWGGASRVKRELVSNAVMIF